MEAAGLVLETRGTVRELESISKALGTNVRGNRLSDLALVNEIEDMSDEEVDRLLAERTASHR